MLFYFYKNQVECRDNPTVYAMKIKKIVEKVFIF